MVTALKGIVRCPNFEEQFNGGTACREILEVQNHVGLNERQVPEPWRGSMASPLLFVSSNPSLDELDDSPRRSDTDGQMLQYFNSKFSKDFPYINIKTNDFQQEQRRYVRYWGSIQARASELWNLAPQHIQAGYDFAMTELVHCKSKRQQGVKKALKPCMELHWENVINSSNAIVVVIVGSIANGALGKKVGDLQIVKLSSGKDRFFLSIPHPNARLRGKDSHKLQNFYSAEVMEDLARNLQLY